MIGAGGLPSDAAWPYCAGDGGCSPCMIGPVSLCGPPPYSCDRSIPQQCKGMAPTAIIDDWTAVSQNETEILQVLT